MVLFLIFFNIANKCHLYLRIKCTLFRVDCQRIFCQLILSIALQRLLFVVISKTRVIIPYSLPLNALNYFLLFLALCYLSRLCSQLHYVAKNLHLICLLEFLHVLKHLRYLLVEVVSESAEGLLN